VNLQFDHITAPLEFVGVLVIFGAVLGLFVQSVVYTVRGKGIWGYVAAWCGLAAAFAVSRVAFLLDPRAEVLSTVSGIQYAIALILCAVILSLARRLAHHTKWSPLERILLLFPVLTLPFVLLWQGFAFGGVSPRLGWGSDVVATVVAGPTGRLFFFYGLLLQAWLARTVWVSERLSKRDKLIFLAAVAGFVATGFADMLGTMGVSSIPPTFNLGLLGVSILFAVLAHLQDRDHRRYLAVQMEMVQAQNRRLQAALREASEARDTRTRFVANMSHEIRTPLNGILGGAHLIESTDLTRDQRDYLRVIRASGRSLLSLVNDVLDFSRIDAQEVVLEEAPFDPVYVVGDVLEAVAIFAADRRLVLRTELSPDLPRTLIGDASRIRQIVLNLVGNALKFTDHGSVTVAAHYDGHRLIFEVRDTGPGISGEEIERIFQPFQQADGSTTRKHSGTGLGLAISRELADCMGGALTVRSELGKGSAFQLTIPTSSPGGVTLRDALVLAGSRVAIVLRDPHAVGNLVELMRAWGADVVSNPDSSDVSAIWSDDVDLLAARPGAAHRIWIARFGDNHTVPEGVRRFAHPLRLQELREALERVHQPARRVQPDLEGTVLVVEDNAVNRMVVRKLIERAGCTVVCAEDGETALAIVEDVAPQLVLMDCQMPGMDGFETTRRLRERMGSSLPVVGFTAHALEEGRALGLRVGMTDYLTKPVDPQRLYGVLRYHMAASGARRPADALADG